LRRRGPIIAGIAASLVALGLLSRIAPSGYTRIDLTEDGTGRDIFSVVVPDGERVTLTWRNSQFGLDVTEGFSARGGVLVQDQVTFSAPDGPPPPRVSPRDVDDLYHTGGAFDAQGLSRPFHRIVYRIGEIGDPKLHVQNKTVSFKQVVGFGGRLILTTTRPALYEILWFRARSASVGTLRGRQGHRSILLAGAFRAVASEQPGAHRVAVNAGETPRRQQDVDDCEACAQ
jgi:hypothetical protein